MFVLKIHLVNLREDQMTEDQMTHCISYIFCKLSSYNEDHRLVSVIFPKGFSSKILYLMFNLYLHYLLTNINLRVIQIQIPLVFIMYKWG